MKANSYFYAWTSYQQRYLIYPLNSYMILNILGREYVFVTRFNPCNLLSPISFTGCARRS